MFLSGIDTFYYFNPWSGLIGGTRATTADNQLLSSLLLELDSMIGCQDRHWIRDMNFRWRDSFFLSGMTVTNRTVWRISFEEDAPTTKVEHGGIVIPDVRFDLGEPHGVTACELHFPGAQLATVTNSLASRNAGVWIVQAGSEGAAEGRLCSVVCGVVPALGWPLQ